MTERFAEVDGVRLRAVDEGAGGAAGPGEGRVVLALHGFTGDASTMSEVVKGLPLSTRAVRLELIGHGGSARPDSFEPYSMSSCVRQVLGMTKALELGRPHVVGYSMGGRVALSAAAAVAEQASEGKSESSFRSLTLIGATAGIEDAEARRERIRADALLADRIERDGIEAFVDAWMALPLFASQKRLGQAKLSAARAQRLQNAPHALARSLRGMGAGAQPPLHDRLASIRIPVLLVAGEQDQKFCDIAEDLASRLPHARCSVIPNAGHAVHLEAPAAFRTVFSDFMQEVEAIAGHRSKGRI